MTPSTSKKASIKRAPRRDMVPSQSEESSYRRELRRRQTELDNFIVSSWT